MKIIAGIGAAAVTGWILLAGAAVEGTTRVTPSVTSASAASCITDCEIRPIHRLLFDEIGGRVTEALAPAQVRPSYGDLWISKEKLRHLAKYHGTHALKITETKVFIRRDGKWIPVLTL